MSTISSRWITFLFHFYDFFVKPSLKTSVLEAYNIKNDATLLCVIQSLLKLLFVHPFVMVASESEPYI